MLAEIGGRDRLVMSGLVVLGLMTVVAGVITGRSTADYVLKEDAREAASSFASKLDAERGKQAAPRDFGEDLQVLDGATSRNEHVSRLDGAAVLGPDKAVSATSDALNPGALQDLMSQRPVAAALNDAFAKHSIEIASGEADTSVVFVPIVEDGKTERVYAFKFDQSAAARFTNVALTVVTITTSMLIVMGFSVPAAIASRRIRERWLAEDQIRIPGSARFAHGSA